MRKEKLFLLTLFAAALALRLFRIGAQSLWVDEIFTVNVSIPKPGLNIWDYLKYNIHGPLHSAVVYLFHFAGSADAWLRVPSALAGAGAVVWIYRWSRLWLGARPAWAAAVLLTFSPLHLYYSQELRNYSFLLFFGLAATYYLHRLLEKESRRDFVLYVVCMVAAVLCNFSAAFLYAAHAIVFLFRKNTTKRRVMRWAAASLVIALLISPWIYRVFVFVDFEKLATPVMPGQLEETERLRGETTFHMAGVPYTFYVFSTGFTLGPSLRDLHVLTSMSDVLRAHGLTVAWAAVLFGALALTGIRRLLLAAGPWQQMLVYLTVPIVATLFLNWQNAKAFNVRYVLVSMPAYLCLLALAFDSFSPRARWLLFGLVGITLGASLGNYYFNGRYAREDVRSAVRAIEADGDGASCIVAPAVNEVVEHYLHADLPVYPVYASARVPRSSVDRQLARIFADCQNLWYVRAREWVNDPDGDLLAAFEKQYQRAQLVEFNGVELYLFRSRDLSH
jgi:uncharacterized membrane protein